MVLKNNQRNTTVACLNNLPTTMEDMHSLHYWRQSLSDTTKLVHVTAEQPQAHRQKVTSSSDMQTGEGRLSSRLSTRRTSSDTALRWSPSYTSFFLSSVLGFNTPPEIFKHRFYELCHEFKNYYYRIFTDGSKEGNRVAAAVVHQDNIKCVRLPDTASIFRAELYLIACDRCK